MAPEQITGGVVTRQTDVYAASVVLWELLTGRRLIEGDNDAHRAAQILASLNGPVFEPPSKYNAQVPPALDELVMRGLAWPPTSRFATAREMAGHLEQNGGLIPSTELGDWVSRLAGPALEERAGRLHAIEASTGRGKTYSFPDASVAGPVDTEQTVAAAPPVFVDERPATGKKRSLALMLALAIALLGVGATVLVWRGRDGGGATARRHASADAPMQAIAAVAAASSVAAMPSAEPAAVAVAPSAAPEPSSKTPTTTPKGKPAAHAAAAPSARPAATTKPAVDCDPPYIVDAENHKVYKRECLK
jgi:serine/threonine-protein kinase